MSVKVSIITPILNRPQWHGCIQRMVEYQTYPIHEHIVAEEKWAGLTHKSKIKNATYIELGASGGETICPLGLKFNLLKKKATGDLIVVMSSDDYFSPNYVQSWIEVFENNDCVAALSRDIAIYNIVENTYTTFTRTHYNGLVAFNQEANKAVEYDSALHNGEDYVFNKAIIERFGEEKFQLVEKNQRESIIIRHTHTSNDVTIKIGDEDAIYARRSGNNRIIGQHASPADATHTPDPDLAFLKSIVKDEYLLDFYTKYEQRFPHLTRL